MGIEPIQHIAQILSLLSFPIDYTGKIKYPDWESNPDQKLRRLSFYPLNYRGYI